MNNSADNLNDRQKSVELACPPDTKQYEVVACWPHDPEAFTEGLQFYNGCLYESTGRHGKSSLRRVDLKTGKVLEKVSLNEKYFGEGITIFDGKIYQLTYTQKVCFVYDLESLKKLHEFKYEGEGWGLTNNGQNLIMSDKTSCLHLRDPNSFKVVGDPINVCLGGKPLDSLNELEFIKGSIYANVFPKSFIVRIDPRDGTVSAQIDLSTLHSSSKENVLNGIAYDESIDHLYVTGKRWDKLYEIRLKD